MKCVKTAFQSTGLENCSISRSPKDGGHASKNICVVTARTVKSQRRCEMGMLKNCG